MPLVRNCRHGHSGLEELLFLEQTGFGTNAVGQVASFFAALISIAVLLSEGECMLSFSSSFLDVQKQCKSSSLKS